LPGCGPSSTIPKDRHRASFSIDSLQLTDNYQVATPVDWHHGDDVIIMPSLSNQEARELFPDGWVEKKSYLRMIAQPNL
jgi:hypothetical protein